MEVPDTALDVAKSFLISMVKSETVFAKKGDVKAIFYNMCDNYYKCLLFLGLVCHREPR